jgi:hypothetical protein
MLSDTEFPISHWSTTAIPLQGASPEGDAFHQPVGGNPGAYWRNEISLQNNEGMRMEHFFQPQRYEPQLQGAIERINYQLDSAFFSNGSYAQHFLLRQDGRTFYYSMPGVSGNWQTDTATSLTAINFYDRQERGIHPDFSSSGGPIEFGFSRQVFIVSGNSFVGRHGADNWSVEIERNERVSLVPARSSWKYLDDGSNQGSPADGALWFGHPDYDDSSWASGAGPFGYGDADIFTTVRFGNNSNNRHVTTYFRKDFEVADPTQLEHLTLNLRRDDGAAVYLNGQEILRDELAPGASFRTLALSTASDTQEYKYYLFPISSDLLHSGINTLAVEIHQASADSSDLNFDLELSASLVPEPNTLALSLLAAGRLLRRRRRRPAH